MHKVQDDPVTGSKIAIVSVGTEVAVEMEIEVDLFWSLLDLRTGLSFGRANEVLAK